jgi:hypothetical protein
VGSFSPPPGPRSRFDTGRVVSQGPSGKTVLAIIVALVIAVYAWNKPPSKLHEQILQGLSADGVATGVSSSAARCSGARGCLVIYVAPWCGPCRDSLPGDRALADYLKEKGVETTFIVGMDKPAQCAEMAKKIGRDVLTDPSGSWAKKMHINGVPHFLVTDVSGNVRRHQAGAMQAPPDAVAKALGL